jgi:gustatory receptor
VVDTVYCSILFFIFCDCSHNATRQVAQGVQDTLLSINLLSIDQPTQKEIDLFIQAIQMNPAIVSLKGYANVNRELLTSVSIRRMDEQNLWSLFMDTSK